MRMVVVVMIMMMERKKGSGVNNTADKVLHLKMLEDP